MNSAIRSPRRWWSRRMRRKRRLPARSARRGYRRTPRSPSTPQRPCEAGERVTSNHVPPLVRVTTVAMWREYAFKRGIGGQDPTPAAKRSTAASSTSLQSAWSACGNPTHGRSHRRHTGQTRPPDRTDKRDTPKGVCPICPVCPSRDGPSDRSQFYPFCPVCPAALGSRSPPSQAPSFSRLARQLR